MVLQTEKESLTTNNYFAFKLRNLYLTDEHLFFQVVSLLPDLVYIKQITEYGWDYKYFNTANRISQSPEGIQILSEGISYLKKVSCPILLANSLQKERILIKNNSLDESCSYYQGLTVFGQREYTYTTKVLIDNSLQVNFSKLISELPKVGKVFTSFFDFVLKDQYSWQRFMSLSKQEKVIIRLLADGKSNQEIGEQLFISPNTIKTHRKNIYRKMEIHKLGDLIKIAMALDLLQDV